MNKCIYNLYNSLFLIKMDNYSSFKTIIRNSLHINSSFFIILYLLFREIFFSDLDDKNKSTLYKYIYYINEKIIKNKGKSISEDYSIKNFDTIINFVKSQNRVFAGEILEELLIIVFGEAFKVGQDCTLNKFIFNNLSKIRNMSTNDFTEWIQEYKFVPQELRNISKLLSMEKQDSFSYNYNYCSFLKLVKESPFLHLLFYINKEKYRHIYSENKNNKTMNYINGGYSDIQNVYKDIFDSLVKNNSGGVYEKDITSNSIAYLLSDVYYVKNPEEIKTLPFSIIKSFFISVFIYYQNKNSPLIKYIGAKNENENNENRQKELVNIPFEISLNEAYIEGRFSNIIFAPIRIEPRISKLNLPKNNMRESGLYELAKVLIFNRNIKSIENNTALIRSIYLDYMNFGFGIFDNDSVEKLNLSFNYLKGDSVEYLAKLLTHFKNLKTLNLSCNDFGNISDVLAVLKKLYRSRKTKLENLFLIKCSLDDASYYELGELIKCKYCKLKKLYINNNPIPLNINFLKKLKKNKSLSELYLNRNNISNRDAPNIMRAISNSHIEHLYLYRNHINNFNEGLRIIYRTKMFNDGHIKDNQSFLIHLDISNNDIIIKNSTQIKLLSNIINKTTIKCLDISHTLYGENPDKMKFTRDNDTYKKNVDKLKTNLIEDKKKYMKTLKELRSKEIDIKRLKNDENEKIFKNLDKDINHIIKNKNANYFVYLMEKAKNIINENRDKYFNENINEKEENDLDAKENQKKIERELANYMMYKKTLLDYHMYEEEKNAKKLIIL